MVEIRKMLLERKRTKQKIISRREKRKRRIMNHCSTDIFADDTTFHINGKTIKEIETKLQCDSLEAHAWSKTINCL